MSTLQCLPSHGFAGDIIGSVEDGRRSPKSRIDLSQQVRNEVSLTSLTSFLSLNTLYSQIQLAIRFLQDVLAVPLRIKSPSPGGMSNIQIMPSKSAREPAKGHSKQPRESLGSVEFGEFAEVAPGGDVVLDVLHSNANGELRQKFRVDSTALKSQSKYFSNLLDSRFTESSRIEKEHGALKIRYKNFDEVPSEELPAIKISDLGRISAIKSMNLFNDFLAVLHARDIAAVPPIVNLANLAIVADRFDALEAFRIYVERKKMLRAIDGKTIPKTEQSLPQDKVRRRILVATLLEYPPWLERYSARMIIKGWKAEELNENAAMWWSLPQGIEEELLLRREYLLDTVQSLLGHHLSLYTSRERQCRLGYDSSAACDSFQLGEAVRFFMRINVLQIRGTVFDIVEAPEAYAGDIFALVESMRQIPEYQVDRNHTHCGLRTKILPILDLIMDALHHIGICSECWSQSRPEHTWNGKRPLLWKRTAYRTRGVSHRELHSQVKTLFCAMEKDWNA